MPGPAVQFAASSNLLFDYGDIVHEQGVAVAMLNKTNMVGTALTYLTNSLINFVQTGLKWSNGNTVYTVIFF